MEDLELEPGDFVSYFARATDGNGVGGAQTATTDIYFLEVRPFGKKYRQAQQGMGGAGQGMDNALSQRQRQIVAATFKIVRDRKSYSEKEYSENLTTIALMQGRLREQVGTLLRRMTNRGIVEGDSDFGKIAASLRLAAEAMEPAEEKTPREEARRRPSTRETSPSTLTACRGGVPRCSGRLRWRWHGWR